MLYTKFDDNSKKDTFILVLNFMFPIPTEAVPLNKEIITEKIIVSIKEILLKHHYEYSLKYLIDVYATLQASGSPGSTLSELFNNDYKSILSIKSMPLNYFLILCDAFINETNKVRKMFEIEPKEVDSFTFQKVPRTSPKHQPN